MKREKTHCLSRSWEKALKKRAKAKYRRADKKACKKD